MPEYKPKLDSQKTLDFMNSFRKATNQESVEDEEDRKKKARLEALRKLRAQSQSPQSY